MPERVTLVLAGNYRQFRRWLHDTGQHESAQVRYVNDLTSLRGVGGPIDLIEVGTAYERRDHAEIVDYVRQINHWAGAGNKERQMADVKQLGQVKAGDLVRANGHEFTVVAVSSDSEGCQQWTLARPGSRCVTEWRKDVEIASKAAGQPGIDTTTHG